MNLPLVEIEVRTSIPFIQPAKRGPHDVYAAKQQDSSNGERQELNPKRNAIAVVTQHDGNDGDITET